MEIEEHIEDLIEQIRPLMPSVGAWPFTVMKLNRSEFKVTSIKRSVSADHQLLFLQRTDFDVADLVDYVMHTQEYNLLDGYSQQDWLYEYAAKMAHAPFLSEWCDRITNLGIGIATGLSEQLDLCMAYTVADLAELDTYFDFPGKNLKAFQLFDIYPCWQ